jgi:hypothetical protein
MVKVNPANPGHLYLSDEALASLARAGVEPTRIEAMRATREATNWIEVPA